MELFEKKYDGGNPEIFVYDVYMDSWTFLVMPKNQQMDPNKISLYFIKFYINAKDQLCIIAYSKYITSVLASIKFC